MTIQFINYLGTRQMANLCQGAHLPLDTASYIRLLIITMTERIMHSEKKHAEYIKQTRKTNNWY